MSWKDEVKELAAQALSADSNDDALRLKESLRRMSTEAAAKGIHGGPIPGLMTRETMLLVVKSYEHTADCVVTACEAVGVRYSVSLLSDLLQIASDIAGSIPNRLRGVLLEESKGHAIANPATFEQSVASQLTQAQAIGMLKVKSALAHYAARSRNERRQGFLRSIAGAAIFLLGAVTTKLVESSPEWFRAVLQALSKARAH